jgi:hypothetical protein
MPRQKPRRASARWLEGAPAYVFDCFDSKGPGDRYTVLIGGEHLSPPDDYNPAWTIPFLGMSDAPTHPQGVSMWGELAQHNAAAWRYRVGHQRVRWLDLPENIRAHVAARVTESEG